MKEEVRRLVIPIGCLPTLRSTNKFTKVTGVTSVFFREKGSVSLLMNRSYFHISNLAVSPNGITQYIPTLKKNRKKQFYRGKVIYFLYSAVVSIVINIDCEFEDSAFLKELNVAHFQI